jgi:hypothetical protein
LIAAAMLMISASADAATYRVDGVTIHVPTHCASTSCVSVAAPGYGYYHAGRRVKPRKEIKAVTVSTKKDEAVAATTAAAVPAAPAPAADPTLAVKAPDKAPDAPASVAEPAAK